MSILPPKVREHNLIIARKHDEGPPDLHLGIHGIKNGPLSEDFRADRSTTQSFKTMPKGIPYGIRPFHRVYHQTYHCSPADIDQSMIRQL